MITAVVDTFTAFGSHMFVCDVAKSHFTFHDTVHNDSQTTGALILPRKLFLGGKYV